MSYILLLFGVILGLTSILTKGHDEHIELIRPKPLKTKLLKKIRKEYQIVYYNKGYIYPSINMYVPECFVIYHKGLELRTFIISYNLNKEEAMLNAKDYLLKHVIDEYRYLKVKKNNPEKVWYNQ